MPESVAMASLRPTTLDDKYTVKTGRILLSGSQALVRLPIMQQQRDAADGIKTAGYISGYRGSPLSTYDRELWRARQFLERNRIVFQPGVNEELAATAIWGTQQLNLLPGARYDGIYSIWYGKGPGVDRSGDVFKHANLAGTARYGGVLAAFGDDHVGKSSTLAHQSEQALAAAMIPILNPANIEDLLAFGRYGWAMSRFAGVWVGLKCVNETMENTATVELRCEVDPIVLPDDMEPPPGGVHIHMGHEPAQAEQRLQRYKLPLAVAFARANGLDKVVFQGTRKRLGIVTAGKAYLDVRQALERLGIDRQRAGQLGIGLYKLALTWPIEPRAMQAFASGFEELLFVEEKRSFIEAQAAALLYDLNAAVRPRIVGKNDERGLPLLPSDGILDAERVARIIAARLRQLGITDGQLERRLDHLNSRKSPIADGNAEIARLPYFCSGCPHNTSTKVPEGSYALAGIGCSYMAMWMDRRTLTSVQMGGEGANWNGIAPFSGTAHIFQNLGDGTYFHSGLMAIRAAVAAGVNITYKILYNDAVAMTGGQPFDGRLTVPRITLQVAAEGVRKIAVVTDEPDKYPEDGGFAPGVTVHHRRDLEVIQRELREIPGTTVLIYDQTCAAEKRRRRKRSEYPDLPKRVFINEAVCEGCGDCSTKSNCVSILPLPTPLGRKRQIDQSACNKDYSCVNGFCPAFVTVHGGGLRKPKVFDQADTAFQDLPEPELPALTAPYNILITGIGGTGVVTVGALLAMAAHLEHKGCSVFDMTGLAQKNGAVTSHVRMASNPDDLHAVRIGDGDTHLLVGCDLVVTATSEVMQTIGQNMTRAIVNKHIVPTGEFQLHGDIDFHRQALCDAIQKATGESHVDFVDATGLAIAVTGGSIATNLFMLGCAYQKGLLPVSRQAIERAIELNGVAVEDNKRAFDWGRLAEHDHGQFLAITKAAVDEPQPGLPESIDDIIEHRASYLTEYQNAAYAKSYQDFIAWVRTTESAKLGSPSGLVRAVADSLFKLMAYKDEYEVARLYTSGAFASKLGARFEGDYKIRFHLAPPLLARRDPVTGELVKREYGSWVFQALKVLAKLKWLRGTALDIFGYTAERRTERALITGYQETVREVLAGLDVQNCGTAVEIAELPQKIRGFGHVKERNLAAVKKEQSRLLERFHQVAP